MQFEEGRAFAPPSWLNPIQIASLGALTPKQGRDTFVRKEFAPSVTGRRTGGAVVRVRGPGDTSKSPLSDCYPGSHTPTG